jgi:large repetitive protein
MTRSWGRSRRRPPVRSRSISLCREQAPPGRILALVVVRGLPKAASLSVGVESGDGSWLLSPRNVAGLSLTVPPGLTADLPLEVVAIRVASRDGTLTSASSTVVVPLRSAAVQVTPASVPLGLDPQALSEGGPFDAIIVLDVPAGATLRPGTYDPVIDAWVLRPRQLTELSVLPASGQNQDFTLSLFGVRLQGGSREAPRILAQVPVSLR